jgi:hypothetical protein
MGSGQREIVMVDLERAEPEDVIRGIRFTTAARNEALRYLNSGRVQGDPFNFPGLVETHDTVPADEVAHQVLGGLLVRCDNIGFLTVERGAVAMFQPARASLTADDSPWIFSDAPAMTDPLILTFLANGGPGIRWDIIECQVAADSVTEGPIVRDVLDPVTEQFSPQNLNKVTKGLVTYRTRRGTQGAGIPAIDPDWCPLAAVHVRADATGFDNCDVYDIRPLLAERCYFSPAHPLVVPTGLVGTGYRLHFAENDIAAATQAGVNGRVLAGYFRAHFGGYWSGGRIRRNLPSASIATFGSTAVTDANTPYFNPEATQNQSSGFSIAGDDRFTIGAYFPRGYPRWVRYSQLPLVPSTANRLRKTGRLPEGPRGILMLTNEQGRGDGIIFPQTLPLHFGETTGAWGHVVAEGMTNGTTDFYPAYSVKDRFYHTGVLVTPQSAGVPTAGAFSLGGVAMPVATFETNAGNTLTSFEFALAQAYPIPPYAREVMLHVTLQIAFGAPAEISPLRALHFPSAGGAGTVIDGIGGSVLTVPTPLDLWNWEGVLWVPIRPRSSFDDDLIASVIDRLAFIIGHTAVAPTARTGQARLMGYRV